MAKLSIENGSLFPFEKIGKFVREVGLPTALLFALGWVSVNYWIKPQTRLIEAMTKANQQMAIAYDSLDRGMAQNYKQLDDILNETRMTTKTIHSAYDLMKDVPEQRDAAFAQGEKQIALLEVFTAGVCACHDQQIENQKLILEKLGN